MVFLKQWTKKFYCNCFTLKNLSSCWKSARTKQVFVVYFGGSALGAVHNWRHANLDFFWPPFPLCHTQMPQPFCTCATKRLNPSPSLCDVIYEWCRSFLYKNIHFYRTKETKNIKKRNKKQKREKQFRLLPESEVWWGPWSIGSVRTWSLTKVVRDGGRPHSKTCSSAKSVQPEAGDHIWIKRKTG